MDFSEAYTDRCSSVGHAARRGDIKSLRKLIKKGCSVDVPDNRGWMPIHEAAFSNAAQCLQLLISSAPSQSYIKSKTFEGESALHLAAKCGSVWCTELLLQAGADPNDLTNDETTPLFLAVESGCGDLVRLLLKFKANVNGPHSCSGWNPLHQASLMERTDLIQLLLESGVDKECEDDFGIRPLFIAAQYGKYESLNLLLSHGADVNCQAKDKATPLFIAAQEGHEKCTELLLSKGADPNLYCNDEAWQLPIHAAAQMGRSKHSNMAPLLLKYGLKLSSLYLQNCLEYNNFPLFRYFLSQHCPLPSGDELDAFKQQSSKSHHKEWLPYLLLAGLDAAYLLDATW
uniref:Ankyrin repeat and SOCS box protein 3 n=2 Tax=Pyxicephalus adspersus TaxID=30357 RepID=A0AAV3A7N2_PYXAD|nr:TPA: hypothetical protein GDO54_011325 [Pyxicephalus adspersus]